MRIIGNQLMPLNEFVTLQRGFDLPNQQRQPGEVPVVASTGIVGFHSEKKVKGPGVVIGRSGSIGGGQYINSDFWPLNTTLWAKDFKGNIPRFVYYMLRNIDFSSFNAGAGVPTLNRNHIASLKIPRFPLKQQTKITDILSTYDDLIEINKRRMALLEEAARQLYKEWFVRLRFPGHEHVKIKNRIPEGWRRSTFGDLCSAVRDAVKPEALEPKTPYIGLEHIPRRSISLCQWGRADQVTSTKHKFKVGDVIFGKIRPYFHKVGIALVDGVASSDAIIIRPHNPNHLGFVLMTASCDQFVATAAQQMKEGAKMPRADWKQMQAYLTPLPPEGLLESFETTIKSIIEQLKILTFANHRLQTARDLLLPRLMNEEITA